MNKSAYLEQLAKLLEANYQELKNTQGRGIDKNERIEGYMMAGLVAEIVTHADLKTVINQTYQSVFGIHFDERDKPSLDSHELWDIPAWIRQGKQL